MFCPIVIRTNGCQYLAYVQVFSLLPLQAAFLLAGGAQVEYRIYAYRAGYAGSCNYDARPYIYIYIYTHIYIYIYTQCAACYAFLCDTTSSFCLTASHQPTVSSPRLSFTFRSQRGFHEAVVSHVRNQNRTEPFTVQVGGTSAKQRLRRRPQSQTPAMCKF